MPKADVDNSLRDRHNPSQHTKAEFNNCFITHPKHFYSGTPPYDHPVYKTTSLLRPYSFKPNVKTIESFYYFEDPVNATTSLLRPGFYGPTVVAITGFYCILNKHMSSWTFFKTLTYFLVRLRLKQTFSLEDTPYSKRQIIYVLRILAFLPFSFRQKFGSFIFGYPRTMIMNNNCK